MIIDEVNISNYVSEELKVTREEVLAVYRSCIAYTIHVMKTSGFETVKLPYFGKFSVNPYRLKLYNENKIKKNELI